MVYKTFGSKAAVAKAVFDLALAGDDEPVPIAERPAALAIQDEPEVGAKITLFVAGLVQRLARSARVQIMVRDGRHVDASLNRSGRTPARGAGRHGTARGQLRATEPARRGAADELSATCSSESTSRSTTTEPGYQRLAGAAVRDLAVGRDHQRPAVERPGPLPPERACSDDETVGPISSSRDGFRLSDPLGGDGISPVHHLRRRRQDAASVPVTLEVVVIPALWW